MAFHSKYLKDTGLITAYQGFLSNIMNMGPPQGDVFLEASKYFTNYEKKHKQHQTVDLPQTDELLNKYIPKERKKLTLESRTRVHPAAAIITPKTFERQERTRPLIGNYKKEEINYKYIDILDGRTVNLGQESKDVEPEAIQVFELGNNEIKELKDNTEAFEEALENAIIDKIEEHEKRDDFE